MDEPILAEFKALLQQQMDALLHDAGKTVSEMTEGKTNFPDPTDRASLESDRNFELRIRDRERKLINKIRQALERIDDGNFGLCQTCEEPIGVERLRARPVTTLCIECKTEEERQERIG
ncbi:MAG: RNA polymerase-binding protein DksA [Deltaproteobacteria bacterium]|nr:RNA polymerase-binding protein DksA [Deltaproteobacteria bacterium]